ncbi:hypothetical protein [Deinococcus hopiensis]|uniref:Uncharacterized protein n=1 Tax=Deinococcus hopiensis KR-140 TaxID=695939 RepID=A0A1W1UXS6_9DEIO|nr:hypothetical protein [Deinococcus hopiensis]SMB85918.1 hypothetical protein SAMN00790413_03600 [Deinococcus hopiensis KR-140]
MHPKTSLAFPVVTTLTSCVQTSLRMLEQRPTAANQVLTARYQQTLTVLTTEQPLTPEQV